MNRRSPKEKRRYPRINKKLPLNIVTNGYDFITTTENVSCVGAYCHVNKYIPPFTKIAVNLRLPLLTGSSRRKQTLLGCRGVVVRTEDERSGGFNIAIFFNHISEEQRKKISQYIRQFLPHNTSCLARMA